MEKKLKQDPTDCLKVVLFGPESTGKTTLAIQLAEHYNSVVVPEFSRIYAEEKLKNGTQLTITDVLPIAEGQMLLENTLAVQANKVLICDTDLLETKVYSELYYFKNCDPILKKYAEENTYDLYFLTYIDTPWKADGLRDRPFDRAQQFEVFENALISNKKRYVKLDGREEIRFKNAVSHINKLIENKK